MREDIVVALVLILFFTLFLLVSFSIPYLSYIKYIINSYKSTIVPKFYKDLYCDRGVRVGVNGIVEYYNEYVFVYKYAIDHHRYITLTLSEQEAHDYFEDPLKPTSTELMLFKLGYNISEENFEAIFGYYLAENKFKYVIKRIIKDFKERKNHEQ